MSTKLKSIIFEDIFSGSPQIFSYLCSISSAVCNVIIEMIVLVQVCKIPSPGKAAAAFSLYYIYSFPDEPNIKKMFPE